MLADALRDALSLRLSHARKLVTHEDPLHVHKLLGVASVTHYAYRYVRYFRSGGGSMGFDLHSPWTALWIALHAALSLTSLVFRLPANRVKGAPMIWPEFRAHSIVFALRSLLVMSVHLLVPNLGRIPVAAARAVMGAGKAAAVFGTLLAADAATAAYKSSHQTMRGMPFPDYVTQRGRDALNAFYSVSQLLATMQMLFCDSIDAAFMVMMPIQMAAFLMTCVRKGLLTSGGWHLWYAAALGSNYLRIVMGGARPPMFRAVFAATATAVTVARFGFRANKYVVWAVAAAVAPWVSYY
jgi:hypothetical protein